MRHRPVLARIVTTVVVTTTAAIGTAVPAQAAQPLFQLPFPCGQTWHGNNSNSSAHATPWEIDFNRGDDEGMPVLAAAAGTVVTAAHQGSANGYGTLGKISHGRSGYNTYYAHLKDMAVEAGQPVAQGQLIGWVGNTSEPGNSISPHLHYEVRLGSSWPDGIQPAYFDGVRFPYPDGDVTSRNCGSGGTPAKPAKSVNGDRFDDAVGVNPDGVAYLYRGTADGDFTTSLRLGPGWSGMTWMGVNDSNGDGWADLWAVEAGTLKYWGNRGDGTFTTPVAVGGGWSAFEYIAFADVNGDNKADILARDGGYMYLYVGKGNGSFTTRVTVSGGWAGLARHTAADADGDGDGDIWATNSLGELFYWQRTTSGYATAKQVGAGWNGFRQMTSMDINGDGKADLLAIRTSDNKLLRWLGTGAGTFGAGTEIGHGWTGWTLAAN